MRGAQYVDPATPYRERITTRSSDHAKPGDIILPSRVNEPWWKRGRQADGER